MVVGIPDPDVLVRVLGADLDVVRPAQDFVPLRLEHHNEVLSSPSTPEWPSCPSRASGQFGFFGIPSGLGALRVNVPRLRLKSKLNPQTNFSATAQENRDSAAAASILSRRWLPVQTRTPCTPLGR